MKVRYIFLWIFLLSLLCMACSTEEEPAIDTITWVPLNSINSNPFIKPACFMLAMGFGDTILYDVSGRVVSKRHPTGLNFLYTYSPGQIDVFDDMGGFSCRYTISDAGLPLVAESLYVGQYKKTTTYHYKDGRIVYAVGIDEVLQKDSTIFIYTIDGANIAEIRWYQHEVNSFKELATQKLFYDDKINPRRGFIDHGAAANSAIMWMNTNNITQTISSSTNPAFESTENFVYSYNEIGLPVTHTYNNLNKTATYSYSNCE